MPADRGLWTTTTLTSDNIVGNWNAINQAGAGQIRSAGDPRHIQFGLKLAF